MSGSAIVMMVVALGIVWGGLIVLILKLRYTKVSEEVIAAYAEEQRMEKLRRERNDVLVSQES